MKILGEYDTSGNFIEFVAPVEVHQFGNTLRNSDGFVQAVKDSYGDWVNPHMKALGLKVKVEVEE